MISLGETITPARHRSTGSDMSALEDLDIAGTSTGKNAHTAAALTQEKMHTLPPASSERLTRGWDDCMFNSDWDDFASQLNWDNCISIRAAFKEFIGDARAATRASACSARKARRVREEQRARTRVLGEILFAR